MMISATLELFTGAIAVNQERVSDSQQSHALFAGTDGHFILNVYLNICHHIVVVIVLLTSCRTHSVLS